MAPLARPLMSGPLYAVGHWLRAVNWFFADLKRRRVFRTMALYGGCSFVALESLSLLAPVLMISDLAYRVFGFLLLAGFPVSMFLAWTYDYDDRVVLTPPASTEELEELVRQPRLRRWPAGLLALAGAVLLATSGWYALVRPAEEIRLHARHPVLAVLPFSVRSSEPMDSVFAIGLHDDALVRLSDIPPLGVVSRTSTLRYAQSPLSLSAIADSLGASVVLEGAVQRSGDIVRITLQLIDARSDEHIWSTWWDEPLAGTDLLPLQGVLAQRIAQAVGLALNGARLMSPDGPGPGPYDWTSTPRRAMATKQPARSISTLPQGDGYPAAGAVDEPEARSPAQGGERNRVLLHQPGLE